MGYLYPLINQIASIGFMASCKQKAAFAAALVWKLTKLGSFFENRQTSALVLYDLHTSWYGIKAAFWLNFAGEEVNTLYATTL
jgi:hypothetical protein